MPVYKGIDKICHMCYTALLQLKRSAVLIGLRVSSLTIHWEYLKLAFRRQKMNQARLTSGGQPNYEEFEQ